MRNNVTLLSLLYLVAPGRPLAVEADASNVFERSAILWWKEPLESNGVIMWYVVYYSEVQAQRKTAVLGEKNVTVVSPQLWVNLTDLTPYTEYRVQVKAVNVRTADAVSLVSPRSGVTVFRTAEGGLYNVSFLDQSSQPFLWDL